MRFFQGLCNRLGEGTCFLVGRRRVQRHINLRIPFRALKTSAGRKSGGPRLIEHFLEPKGDLGALNGMGGRTRIEIENDLRWPVDVRRIGEEGVKFQIAQIGRPNERGEIINQAKLNIARLVMPGDSAGFDKGRFRFGTLFFVEEGSRHSIGIALHGQRPPLQMREQNRRNLLYSRLA